jgi:lambda family phage minor tail protein L
VSIAADIQKANAGQVVEVFEIDLTPIGHDEQYYFHNGLNELLENVTWQGQIYTRFPIEAEGFEKIGSGKNPRPTLRIANISGIIGALAVANDDLVNATVIRRRTFLRYLDAINFEDGNLQADPNVHFDDEIWYINRKANSDLIFVEFELAAATDLQGVLLPRRQCLQNVCTWQYRSPECSYAGPPVATKNDEATSDPALDKCGKRLNSCKLRFGTADLPYGAFPSVGLIR